MREGPWRSQVVAAMLVVVVSAFGLGVRALLVQVPPGAETPPMCQFSSDFWRGDEILC